jgi:hypothetical protein
MAFDKVRQIKIVILLFSVPVWETRCINSLSLDFSCECGMVVYKVQTLNVLILLQTYWDVELKVSNKSLWVSKETIFYQQQLSWTDTSVIYNLIGNMLIKMYNNILIDWLYLFPPYLKLHFINEINKPV